MKAIAGVFLSDGSMWFGTPEFNGEIAFRIGAQSEDDLEDALRRNHFRPLLVTHLEYQSAPALEPQTAKANG